MIYLKHGCPEIVDCTYKVYDCKPYFDNCQNCSVAVVINEIKNCRKAPCNGTFCSSTCLINNPLDHLHDCPVNGSSCLEDMPCDILKSCVNPWIVSTLVICASLICIIALVVFGVCSNCGELCVCVKKRCRTDPEKQALIE